MWVEEVFNDRLASWIEDAHITNGVKIKEHEPLSVHVYMESGEFPLQPATYQERYSLTVDANSVVIQTQGPQGALNALTTLRALVECTEGA